MPLQILYEYEETPMAAGADTIVVEPVGWMGDLDMLLVGHSAWRWKGWRGNISFYGEMRSMFYLAIINSAIFLLGEMVAPSPISVTFPEGFAAFLNERLGPTSYAAAAALWVTLHLGQDDSAAAEFWLMPCLGQLGDSATVDKMMSAYQGCVE